MIEKLQEHWRHVEEHDLAIQSELVLVQEDREPLWTGYLHGHGHVGLEQRREQVVVSIAFPDRRHVKGLQDVRPQRGHLYVLLVRNPSVVHPAERFEDRDRLTSFIGSL